MKAVRQAAMLLMAAALLITLFFTAFQVGIFNMRYIDREMDKLQIADAVSMEPEDLHVLFEETLRYLSDERDDLVIQTVVDGVEREAYNEREKLHMVDVKGLFDGGFQIRNTALLVTVLLTLIIFALRSKATWKSFVKEWTRAVVWVWGLLLILFLIAILLIASDFNRYFILFHHLFFDNDLWILDPATSLMINMLPEVFFYDTVMRIGLLFVVPYILIVTGCSLVWYRLSRKKAEP